MCTVVASSASVARGHYARKDRAIAGTLEPHEPMNYSLGMSLEDACHLPLHLICCIF